MGGGREGRGKGGEGVMLVKGQLVESSWILAFSPANVWPPGSIFFFADAFSSRTFHISASDWSGSALIWLSWIRIRFHLTLLDPDPASMHEIDNNEQSSPISTFRKCFCRYLPRFVWNYYLLIVKQKCKIFFVVAKPGHVRIRIRIGLAPQIRIREPYRKPWGTETVAHFISLESFSYQYQNMVNSNAFFYFLYRK